MSHHSPSFVAIIFTIIALLLWVLPVVFILKSNKVKGDEKITWILAVVFFGWIAWLIFVWKTTSKKD